MKTRSRMRTGVLVRYAIALVTCGVAAGLLVAGGAHGARAAGNATYSFVGNPYTVTEGGTATLTVHRASPTTGDAAVCYTVSPTTGVSASSGSVNSFDGSGNGTIAIAIGQDVVNSGPRSFSVTLTFASCGGNTGSISGTNPATVNIIDDDGPSSYSYGSATYSANEGDASINIQVIRTGSTNNTDSVSCTVTGGTASGGGDYSLVTALASFPPGATSANCVINLVNDPNTEPSETIIMGFTAPSGFPGGGVAPQSTTVTIVDNDGPGTLQFAQSTFTVNEGSGTASLAVTRTGGSTGAASIQCSTIAGGSATASPAAGFDYTVVSFQLLQWANGDAATKFCSVPITQDALVEGDETFLVQLSLESGAGLGVPSTATVTINDDDGTGTLAFTSATFAAAENAGVVTVTVDRSGGSSGTVGVAWATSNGTATTANSDYVAGSGTLSWGNGETGTRSFTVTILDDALVESNETFNITLSDPTGGAVLGTITVTVVTITDNETALPAITSLTPAAGTLAGGTQVIITGINFTGAYSVTFGGGTAAITVAATATSITVQSPPAPGGTAQTVNVVVTTPSGSSSTVGSADDFTYTGGPTVTLISPNQGGTAGNTIVAITGTGFTSTGMTVKFGGVEAIFTYLSPTSASAASPAHAAGIVDVIVTTPGGSSPNTTADDFTYLGSGAPVVSAVTPNTGPVGTIVTVSGSGFTGVTSVTVGGVSASFTFTNDGSLSVTIPAGTPGGVVDVRVTTPLGTSLNVAADNFTNTTNNTATTVYVLYFRWTLIAWTGIDNISAFNAVHGIETGTANPATNDVSAQVTAIWTWDASVQAYKGYFVGFENTPGANDFTTLKRGTSYWVAVAGPGNTTWTVLSGQ